MYTEAAPWTPRRWLSVIVALILTAALLVYVIFRLNEARFAWSYIPEHVFDPILREGAWATIRLSVIAQAAGILLGLFAALFKISKNPVLNAVAAAYIWLFRGTPLLVQ